MSHGSIAYTQYCICKTLGNLKISESSGKAHFQIYCLRSF